MSGEAPGPGRGEEGAASSRPSWARRLMDLMFGGAMTLALAVGALLLGVLLFAGSLVAAHAFGLPTHLAPLGGSLMILGWLLHAAAAVRGR